jgi:hypothetical protein
MGIKMKGIMDRSVKIIFWPNRKKETACTNKEDIRELPEGL